MSIFRTKFNRRLLVECLEQRFCLSTSYDIEVVAQTGGAISKIEDLVSVNDSGHVAFIAENIGQNSGVYVGNGKAEPKLVSFLGGGRLYGRAASINDVDTGSYVVARDLDVLSGSSLRKWPTSGSVDGRVLVAASVDMLNVFEPEHFSSLLSLSDVNDKNQVVFVGVDSSSGTPIHKLQVRETIGLASVGKYIEIGDFSNDTGLRPQISNTTEVVFRSPSGQSIFKTDQNSDKFRRVAGSQEGFLSQGDTPAVGRSPGISDDGNVVVFFGNHPDENKPGDGLGGGPGIFASLLKPGGNRNGGSGERVLVRLAGVAAELGYDTNGNPISLAQFATLSSVNNAISTDSRVGIGGSLSFEKGTDSQLFVTFLANDPRNGNRETLWRVEFTSAIDQQGVMQLSVAKPEAVLAIGELIQPSPPLAARTVTDLEIYDPITNRGDIAFWAKLDNGGQAVVSASRPRNPVLIIPGIGGTFAGKDYLDWLLKRGEHPDNIQIDPLMRSYDDLIATMENAGYVQLNKQPENYNPQGKNFFVVANYDWRVLPGPIDQYNLENVGGRFDGRIELKDLDKHVNGERFEYGIDYLLYWLKRTVETWHRSHPNMQLKAVDVIAHSTGGLVTRSFIQSNAYDAIYKSTFGDVALPRIDKFVMVAVPNRGAAKAWNPLHDDWNDDFAYQFVLSKVLNEAWEKQKNLDIRGPDPTGNDSIYNETDRIRFIERYVPTIRSLLATYNFYDIHVPEEYINDRPKERNNLVLDLNSGLDFDDTVDPVRANEFAKRVGQVISVVGTNYETTPLKVNKNVGPSTFFDPLFSFTDTFDRQPKQGEEWYEQESCVCGDGTVPLASSLDQFSGDSRIKLFPFTKGENTNVNRVGHTQLLANPDVQATILRELGVKIEGSKISSDKLKNIADWGTVGEVKLLNFLMDPVEGFLVDGRGRRLGYTAATGVVSEIPGGVYFGKEDGIGWVFGPIETPLTLQLSGLGADHFAQVTGAAGATRFGIESRGQLAHGETRNQTVIQSINYPPVANDDTAEAGTAQTVSIDVLANDNDPEGKVLRIASLDTTQTHGTAQITPANKIAYTAARGFEGIDSLKYTISDDQGALSTAEVRIVVPGRPRIVAIGPGPNDQVTSLRTITIDFSHPMELASVSNASYYKLLHEDLGLLPIASIAYADAGDRHRATLTLSAGLAILPGRVHIQVDGRALRTITGLSISSGRDDVLVVTPDNNEISLVGLTQDGSYQAKEFSTIPGLDTPRSIDSADFNLDGFADVVSVSAVTGQLVIYFGQGEGAFEAPTTINLPAPALDSTVNPQQVKVADWNGDLLPDLVVYDASSIKRILVYLNDGQGKFSIAPDTPIPLSPDDYGTILGVADFTGDSLTDIAVTGSYSGGSIAVYGKDRFLGYTRVFAVSSVPGWLPTGGVMGDFNKDGKMDLAVSNTGYYLANPGTVVFLSTPTGLDSGRVLQYEYLNEGPISVGDFTGDGNLDLAILHDYYRNSEDVHDGAVISMLAGDGHGNFNSLPNQILGRRALGLASTGDINGDGKLDLVLTAAPWPENYTGGFPGLEHYSTWSLKGDGHGIFTPITLAPIPIEPVGIGDYSSIAMGDFNGDNALDLIAASPDDHAIRLLLSDKKGVFRSSPLPIETGVLLNTVNYKSRKLADINSDGITDLIVLAGANAKQLIVFLGTPNGKMESQFALSVPGSANGWIQTGDLNNDGNLDIVAQTSATGVVVLLGRGDGQFFIANDSPFDIVGFEYLDSRTPGTIADLNGDGKPDLLIRVASLQGYSVTPTGWAVYFGDGTGKLFFNVNTYLAFPSGFLDEYQCTQGYPMAVRDFDADGKVDFLVSAWVNGSSTLTVYHGIGNGIFTPGTVTSHAISNAVCGFEPMDFNGDGKLDVIGYGDYSFELLLGDGRGHYNLLDGATHAMHEFKNTSSSTNYYRFGRVAVGDFNGDGSQDIALSKTSYQGSDYNENIQIAALFINDGTGKFQDGSFVRLNSYPDSLQSVQYNRWVEGGAILIAPVLWPINVTSPDVLSIYNQLLAGTGPAQATLHVKKGEKEIGQTQVGVDGRWSFMISPGLGEGYHSLQLIASDAQSQVSAEKQLTILVTAVSRWQNPRSPLDVDNDLTISPLDVLSVINYINSNASGLLPTSGISPPPYYDVDADGYASPLDVLAIINYINQKGSGGEGESSAISTRDRLFSEENSLHEIRTPSLDFDKFFAIEDWLEPSLYNGSRFKRIRR